MDIIDRIFKLIKEKGINAAILTREAGLTQGLTSQWRQKKQNPSHDAIVKIAAYFNVSTDYLLGIEKAPKQIEADADILELYKLYMALSGREKVIFLKNMEDEVCQRFVDYLALLCQE